MFILDWLIDRVRLNEDWEGNEDEYDDMEDEEKPVTEYEPRRSFYTSTRRGCAKQWDTRGIASDRKICMLHLNTFNECQEAAGYLLANQVVILGLGKMEQGSAQRIIDFISGIVYAINGDFKQISQDIFIAAPTGTDLTGKFEDLVKLKEQDTAWNFEKIWKGQAMDMVAG